MTEYEIRDLPSPITNPYTGETITQQVRVKGSSTWRAGSDIGKGISRASADSPTRAPQPGDIITQKGQQIGVITQSDKGLQVETQVPPQVAKQPSKVLREVAIGTAPEGKILVKNVQTGETTEREPIPIATTKIISSPYTPAKPMSVQRTGTLGFVAGLRTISEPEISISPVENPLASVLSNIPTDLPQKDPAVLPRDIAGVAFRALVTGQPQGDITRADIVYTAGKYFTSAGAAYLAVPKLILKMPGIVSEVIKNPAKSIVSGSRFIIGGIYTASTIPKLLVEQPDVVVDVISSHATEVGGYALGAAGFTASARAVWESQYTPKIEYEDIAGVKVVGVKWNKKGYIIGRTGQFDISKLETGVQVKTATGGKFLQQIFKETPQGERLGLGLDIMRSTEKVSSKYVRNVIKTEMKFSSPEQTEAILKWVQQQEGDIYGSFAAVQQMPDELIRTPADIDVQLHTFNPDLVAQETKKLADYLNKLPGYKVRVSPQTPTLIESQVAGEWHHVVDIHSYSDAQGVIETAFGMKLGQPSIQVGGVKLMPLSEQGLRKGSSILTLRKGDVGLTLAPEAHRIKDIPDFYAVTKTLAGSQNLIKGSQTLEWIKKMESIYPGVTSKTVKLGMSFAPSSIPIVSTSSMVSLVSLGSLSLPVAPVSSRSSPMLKSPSKTVKIIPPVSIPKSISKSKSKTISISSSISIPKSTSFYPNVAESSSPSISGTWKVASLSKPPSKSSSISTSIPSSRSLSRSLGKSISKSLSKSSSLSPSVSPSLARYYKSQKPTKQTVPRVSFSFGARQIVFKSKFNFGKILGTTTDKRKRKKGILNLKGLKINV